METCFSPDPSTLRYYQDRTVQGGSLAFRHLKSIPRSPHGLQIPRVLRIDLDLLTNAPHIYVHRTGRDEARVPPNRIEKMIATVNAPRVSRQVIQQPKLRCGSRGERAPHHQLHGVSVDHHLFKLDYRRRSGALKPPQYRLYPRHQLP